MQQMESGMKSFFPATWDTDELTLPLKGAEDVSVGPVGSPETTVLHEPHNVFSRGPGYRSCSFNLYV